MDEAYVGVTGGNRTPTKAAAVESRAEQREQNQGSTPPITSNYWVFLLLRPT